MGSGILSTLKQSRDKSLSLLPRHWGLILQSVDRRQVTFVAALWLGLALIVLTNDDQGANIGAGLLYLAATVISIGMALALVRQPKSRQAEQARRVGSSERLSLYAISRGAAMTSLGLFSGLLVARWVDLAPVVILDVLNILAVLLLLGSWAAVGRGQGPRS